MIRYPYFSFQNDFTIKIRMMFALKITILWTLIASSVYSAEFDIRLAGGETNSKGLLEVYYRGEWGTVCDDEWDEADARVVCSELGFGPPLSYIIVTGYYGGDSQPIWLDDVECTGTESRLSLCNHATIDTHNCDHTEDVALECLYMVTNFSIRLVDGIYANVGRLEVYYSEQWTKVCDDEWTETNSQVVCNELGYVRSEDWVSNYYIRDSSAPYVFNFRCSGGETVLGDCRNSYYDGYYCYNSVAIQCTSEYEYYSQGDVRLVGGYHEFEGIVEVYLYGTWGTICSNEWGESESQVLCQQLGSEYTGGVRDAYDFDTSEVDNIPIHEVNFDCYGGEYSLSGCTLGTNSYSICIGIMNTVAISCRKNDSGGLSGGAIAGIVIGSSVGFYWLYAWLCGKKKTNQPATNNATTTGTDIPLELQTNGNQDVVPSAPPGSVDLPPAYDSVMQEPDRYKIPIEIEETPPPAYIGYPNPPLNLGFGNQGF